MSVKKEMLSLIRDARIFMFRIPKSRLEQERIAFRAVNVWDIAQTYGKPLPDFKVPELTQDDGHALFDRLEGLAKDEGITVERGSQRFTHRDGMMGFYLPGVKEIHLRQAAMRQMTKTLAHELAHHFAQHPDSNPESETEAEAVSYVVLAHHGIDSGERSFPYIATWAMDKDTLKAALGNIQRLSRTIIDRVSSHPAPTNGIAAI